MAQTFWPFPKGSAGSKSTEADWSLMGRNWLATGVIQGFLNQLAVTASGNAMQVNINTGAANIMGDWFKNDASVAMPIAAADPTNPRIDVIAIRVDWVANTVAFVVLQGTPNANPVAPALTQTDILITPATARWEMALANVSVAANATAITAANITDERTFTAAPTSAPTPGATVQYDQSGGLHLNSLNGVTPDTSWYQPTLQNGWTNVGSPNALAGYRKDTSGFVHLAGLIKPGTSSSGTTIFTLPAGYRPLSVRNLSTLGFVNSAYSLNIDVQTSGSIQLGEALQSYTGWITLDGLSFLAEQ